MHSRTADHTAVKPSAAGRVDKIKNDMRLRIPVTVRIEYLQGGRRRYHENRKAQQDTAQQKRTTIQQSVFVKNLRTTSLLMMLCIVTL
jgi:hypothetical protein